MALGLLLGFWFTAAEFAPRPRGNTLQAGMLHTGSDGPCSVPKRTPAAPCPGKQGRAAPKHSFPFPLLLAPGRGACRLPSASAGHPARDPALWDLCSPVSRNIGLREFSGGWFHVALLRLVLRGRIWTLVGQAEGSGFAAS